MSVSTALRGVPIILGRTKLGFFLSLIINVIDWIGLVTKLNMIKFVFSAFWFELALRLFHQ